MKRIAYPRPASTGAGGARVELEEADRVKLAAMAGAGQSQRFAARLLGIAPDTLRAVFERDPEALAAWETGRAEFERTIVGEIYRIAMDRTHPKQALMLLALANNLLGWVRGEAQDTEQSCVRVTLELPAALDAGQYAAVIARGRELPALEAEAEPA
jgi:hypothetical protein